MDSISPTIVKIESLGIMADRRAYRVIFHYGDPENANTWVFTGPTCDYGPVVFMFGPHQDFVVEPARFGPFGEQWVRNFFAW